MVHYLKRIHDETGVDHVTRSSFFHTVRRTTTHCLLFDRRNCVDRIRICMQSIPFRSAGLWKTPSANGQNADRCTRYQRQAGFTGDARSPTPPICAGAEEIPRLRGFPVIHRSRSDNFAAVYRCFDDRAVGAEKRQTCFGNWNRLGVSSRDSGGIGERSLHNRNC